MSLGQATPHSCTTCALSFTGVSLPNPLPVQSFFDEDQRQAFSLEPWMSGIMPTIIVLA